MAQLLVVLTEAVYRGYPVAVPPPSPRGASYLYARAGGAHAGGDRCNDRSAPAAAVGGTPPAPLATAHLKRRGRLISLKS
eukprot:1677507-Prymnesium_polylepis.1